MFSVKSNELLFSPASVEVTIVGGKISNLVMCESIMFNLEDIKVISSDFLIPFCIFDLETLQF